MVKIWINIIIFNSISLAIVNPGFPVDKLTNHVIIQIKLMHTVITDRDWKDTNEIYGINGYHCRPGIK